MTVKSVLNIGLVTAMAFGLVACGGPSSDKPAEPAKPAPVEKAEPPAPKVDAKPSVDASSPEAQQAALLKRGRIVWFKCRSCHELGVDGPHKVGPNLNGLIDAEAAKKEGFVYSKAMENAGIVWDEAALDAFIEKPSAYLKGTKMAFVGIRKDTDRKAVIAYIKENAKPVE